MNPYLGEIKLLPWPFAPKGWRLCDGSILAIQSNTALFSLLGTQYGGNGSTTFALPDLRGRAPVHFGSVYTQGELAGSENVTLLLNQMPMHAHPLQGTSQTGDAPLPNTRAFAQGSVPADTHYATDTTTVTINAATVQSNGGNQPHPNMQPFLVLNYCIATSGIFPSRN